MKKKILYGILFISIFLLSTTSMVQPVRGYEHGIPKEAVGVTVESEIKLYDEDEWEKHFGKKGSDPEDVFDSGMDEVGAKSKKLILEIEEDEELIDFLDDHLFETDTSKAVGDQLGIPGWCPTVGEAITVMDNILGTYANVSSSKTWLIQKGLPSTMAIEVLVYNLMLTQGMNSGFGAFFPSLPAAEDGADIANTRATTGIMNESEIVDRYGDTYDGTYLHVDQWDYISPDEEFDAEPDDEDEELPFLADPRDWYDQAEIITMTTYDFNYKMDAIEAAWEKWWDNMNVTLTSDPLPGGFLMGNHPYKAYNDSLAGMALGMGILPMLIDLMAVPRNITAVPGSVITFEAVHDLVYGMYLFVRGTLEAINLMHWALIPTPTGLLWLFLTDGLPTYQPSDDFWAKVLDLFDVDDEKVIDNLYYLLGYPVYLDVSLEGSVVTVDIEFEEDTIDKTDPTDIDPDDTLEDFTVIFGDDVFFENDDGEVFYQSGGVDKIPGYEVTIILGASAVSILALVYVIMKKRKR